IVGGNLSMLHSMAAASALTIPHGAIVAIEDVTERPYRIDRMLTSLIVGGHLARASGIVLGSFTSCDPGADGRTALQVITERTHSLGIPVLAGAPFGHDDTNDAFVLGRHVTIRGGTLSFC
ncbi:MAG: LD-carboxypeptidase, partial [Polyangiaceae bacterium]